MCLSKIILIKIRKSVYARNYLTLLFFLLFNNLFHDNNHKKVSTDVVRIELIICGAQQHPSNSEY